MLGGASIPFQVFQRIVPINMMGREKRLKLIAGFETEQAPEVRLPQGALLIRTYRIFFEDMAGDILPVLLMHLLGNIVGDMEGHFHHEEPYRCFYLSGRKRFFLTLANS